MLLLQNTAFNSKMLILSQGRNLKCVHSMVYAFLNFNVVAGLKNVDFFYLNIQICAFSCVYDWLGIFLTGTTFVKTSEALIHN